MFGNHPHSVAAALLIWPLDVTGTTWRVRFVSADSDEIEEFAIGESEHASTAKTRALVWAAQYGFDATGPWLEVGESHNPDPRFKDLPSSFCIAGTSVVPGGLSRFPQ